MYAPKTQTPPAERQVVRFRKWLASLQVKTAHDILFQQLAKAFELQLDSDCYRSANWSNGEFSFVTDSEHCISVRISYGQFNAKNVQRKAQFWVKAKGTDVVYRNWQVFGDALRELDFVLVGFKPIMNGFVAGFGAEIGGQQVTFTIKAAPTERFDLNRDYSPVNAAERMAPF